MSGAGLLSEGSGATGPSNSSDEFPLWLFLLRRRFSLNEVLHFISACMHHFGKLLVNFGPESLQFSLQGLVKAGSTGGDCFRHGRQRDGQRHRHLVIIIIMVPHGC